MADENGCVAYSFSDEPTYGYRPSLAAGIIFTILFTASTSAHVYQLVLTRTWWLTVFVIGGFGMFFSVPRVAEKHTVTPMTGLLTFFFSLFFEQGKYSDGRLE